MRIKIIKKKKSENFTFIDDGLDLSEQQYAKAEAKGDKSGPSFRLRESGRPNKLKKSGMTGGHGMQGHSPVYE